MNKKPKFVIRPLAIGDEPFVWKMLYYAAHVDEEPGRTIEDMKGDSGLAKYVSGWGRPGDLGYIAEMPEETTPIGAAWCRIYVGPEKAYSAVDDCTPEIAVAVDPEYIGLGIGTALMVRLLEHACEQFSEIALNVRAENPASRLYRRMGFERVREMANRVGGLSYDMKLKLK